MQVAYTSNLLAQLCGKEIVLTAQCSLSVEMLAIIVLVSVAAAFVQQVTQGFCIRPCV